MSSVTCPNNDEKDFDHQVLAMGTYSDGRSLVSVDVDFGIQKDSLCLNNGKTYAAIFKDSCIGVDMESCHEINEVNDYGEKYDDENATKEIEIKEISGESKGVVLIQRSVATDETYLDKKFAKEVKMMVAKISKNFKLSPPKPNDGFWSDVYEVVQNSLEGRCNIVPIILQMLGSKTSDSSTYYGKGQLYLKKKAEEKEKQRREHELELQQQLAEERYDKWCEKKEKQRKKNCKKAASSKLSLYFKNGKRTKESTESVQKLQEIWERANEAKLKIDRECLCKAKEKKERHVVLRQKKFSDRLEKLET